MTVSLLQFVVIIASVIFIIFGIDLYKRKKMNILHFLVFFLGWGLVILFAFKIDLLNQFWQYFGVARGADLFVYIGLIVLFYFYFDLLNKNTKGKMQLTKLISQEAINRTYLKNKEKINRRKNKWEKDDYIFHIRIRNEAITIGKVIDDIIQAGFNKILIINDWSIDGSLEILEQKQKEYHDKFILIISHTINRGGGAANQTGYNFIKQHGKKLQIKRGITFDADDQMNIDDIPKFLSKIKELEKKDKKIDLLVGSRFVNGGSRENIPPLRTLILKISKLVTFLFYGTKISDPHCGLRVIHLNTFKQFHLTADGMHYANEINEQIKKYKMQYREIPIHIRYTDYSLKKGQKNFNSIHLGFEMIYKKLFFR